MAKHESRRAVGRISMPAQGVEGDVEIFAARPALMRLRMTIPGVGEIQSGYDGKVAWSVNPLTGPMLMQGKALEQTKADADFDSSLHPETLYKSLETVEKTTFEGRPAYKVRAVRTNGDEDFEYYDAENGLLLGAEVTRESPMGPVKATHVTSDYKDFGGVKIASRVAQRLMGTEQVITISHVEFDKVDKSVFDLPPAIQALVK
jgi:outer membrane lipoprotein-sorting protein